MAAVLNFSDLNNAHI